MKGIPTRPDCLLQAQSGLAVGEGKICLGRALLVKWTCPVALLAALRVKEYTR